MATPNSTSPSPEDITALEAKLQNLITDADHSEIWSIPLTEPSPQRTLVLHKYLVAHKTVPAASAALFETLKWRKAFNPVAAIDEPHDAERFGGLGFVTSVDAGSDASEKGGAGGALEGVVKTGGGGRRAVVTWNVYGAVKDHKKTFGEQDGEAFLRWRVGLMERGVRELKLMEGNAPSEDIGIVQIHDYLNVSFFRLPAETKAATKKTIEVLSAHYPELLSRKYFVNVPVIMGWVFTAIKAFLSKETIAKFQVLSYGSGIAAELGKEVPKDYGGEGATLEEQDVWKGKTDEKGQAQEVANNTAPAPTTTTAAATTTSTTEEPSVKKGEEVKTEPIADMSVDATPVKADEANPTAAS